MKKYLLYILSFWGLVSLYSCGDMESPVVHFQKNHSTKTMSKYSLDLNSFEREHLVLQETYDMKGAIVSKKIYDDEEKITQLINYDYSTEFRLDTLFELSDEDKLIPVKVTAISYNFETGKIASSITSNINGDTLEKRTYEYDYNGNLLSSYFENCKTGASTKINYQSNYNSNGQLISQDEFINDELVGNKEYAYSNGDVNSVTVTDTKVAGGTSIIQYTTNNSGMVLNEIHYDKDYKVIEAFEYIYTFY